MAWNENYFHGQKLFENSFSVFILFPSVHTRNPGFQKICMGLVNLKPEQNSWNVTDELHCVPCHIKTKEDRAHLFFFQVQGFETIFKSLGSLAMIWLILQRGQGTLPANLSFQKLSFWLGGTYG